MSDLTNPYGVGGASQGGYGQQGAYGAQAAYGSQASYGGAPPYGAGQSQGYGQPAYGSFAYSLNPAVERVRSTPSMDRIMALISFATRGPILSIGALVWGCMLMS